MGAVVILTGPPGAGKSTVAARYARTLAKAVHLHADDFWHYIVAGAIPAFERASHQQNQVIMDVIAAAAFAYAAGGYLTVTDAIIGPWMLDRFREPARRHPDVDLHYVVLRPQREVTLARAVARRAAGALTDEGPVLHMWKEFAHVGRFEDHVLDTSGEDEATTAERVAEQVASGRMRLRF